MLLQGQRVKYFFFFFFLPLTLLTNYTALVNGGNKFPEYWIVLAGVYCFFKPSALLIITNFSDILLRDKCY